MKTRYILEFQLIPKLVTLYNDRKSELFKVIDPRVWAELLSKMKLPGFRAKEYKTSFFKDENGTFYILITCPEPELPTQVKYMVFVLKGTNTLDITGNAGKLEYFTLEKSIGFYAVCAPGDGFHSNCGFMKGEPNGAEFLARVSNGKALIPVQNIESVKTPDTKNKKAVIAFSFIALIITIAILLML